MGFLNLIYYVVITTTVTFLVLNHAPNLLDIEPQPFTAKPLKFEGALAVNNYLDKGQVLLKDEVFAPECLVEINGEIVTGNSQTGKIISIKNDKISRVVTDTSGCPAGLRFFENNLYVADIEKGLLKVDVNTGKITVLVPRGQKVGGVRLNFADDLDIHNGIVYFSDEYPTWNGSNWYYGMWEHANTGRIFKHDLKSGKTEVLLDRLTSPNGVQVSKDKESLLFSEYLNGRILRHYLSGPKKGQTEVFADLPGDTDNLRLSPRGTYWVGVHNCRDVNSPTWEERLGPYPKIRKALARLSHVLADALEWINQFISSPAISSISEELKSGKHLIPLRETSHAAVIELDTNGKILRSLHSHIPELAFISHAHERNGELYIGSYKSHNLFKIKLPA